MNCDLLFYKLDGRESFTFDHYVTTVRAEIPIPKVKIGPVDVAKLEQQMWDIDWYTLMPAEGSPAYLKNDQILNNLIGSIMTDLYILAKSEEGKPINLLLKAKFFSKTEQIVNDRLQKELDQIDRQYSKSLIIPVREGPSITLSHSLTLLENDFANASQLHKDHEILYVKTNGIIKADGTDGSIDMFKNEQRYFTSLETAFAQVQKVDERLFIPVISPHNQEVSSIGRSAIYDCKDDRLIAEKGGIVTTDPQGVFHEIGWQLNPDKITPSQFEERTRLPLSEMEVFQLEPPTYIQRKGKTPGHEETRLRGSNTKKKPPPPHNGHRK